MNKNPQNSRSDKAEKKKERKKKGDSPSVSEILLAIVEIITFFLR